MYPLCIHSMIYGYFGIGLGLGAKNADRYTHTNTYVTKNVLMTLLSKKEISVLLLYTCTLLINKVLLLLSDPSILIIGENHRAFDERKYVMGLDFGTVLY